jgi:hypothetical protein
MNMHIESVWTLFVEYICSFLSKQNLELGFDPLSSIPGSATAHTCKMKRIREVLQRKRKWWKKKGRREKKIKG